MCNSTPLGHRRQSDTSWPEIYQSDEQLLTVLILLGRLKASGLWTIERLDGRPEAEDLLMPEASNQVSHRAHHSICF